MEELLLVAKDVVEYGSSKGANTIDVATTPDTLREGALGFFDEASVLVVSTTAAADLADEKVITIAVGLAAGAFISNPIDRRGILRWDLQAYVAPVLHVVDVTPTLLSPQTARDAYEVVIINTTPGYIPTDREVFQLVSPGPAGFATLTAFIDAMVLIINDGPTGSEFVTASNSGGTEIRLTAKNNGEHFVVSLREGLESDVKAVQTAFNPGSGTPPQLVVLEDNLNTLRGETNKVWLTDKYGILASRVDLAETYDIYALERANPHQRKDGMDAQFARTLRTVIALPAGATQQTAFELVATEAFGNAASFEPGDDT